MNTEERLVRLEKLVEQLWNACRNFEVEIDNCECGCCPTCATIDISYFSEIEDDN